MRRRRKPLCDASQCGKIYCKPSLANFITSIKYFNVFLLIFTVLPPTTSTSKATKLEDICKKSDDGGESSMSSLASNSTNSSTTSSLQQQQTSRRLISVDFSLFKVSDENCWNFDAK